MKIDPLIIVQHYGRDILESHQRVCALTGGSVNLRPDCVFSSEVSIETPKQASAGALLHDYFLYDWHAKHEVHSLHGLFHPGRALKNAERDFSLSPTERNMIKTHMFPLTLPPPKCKESWILVVADKVCAIKETFGK